MAITVAGLTKKPEEKKIDPSKKLPENYTGVIVHYFNDADESVATKEEAVRAVVNEYKDGKRVKEVFLMLKGGEAAESTEKTKEDLHKD